MELQEGAADVEAVHDILSKLRFIAKIKPGERVDVGRLAVSADGWCAGLGRLWQNEGRETTLAFMRRTVDDALATAGQMLGSPLEFNKELGRMLLAGLEEARVGVAALARTYESDRMFVAKVEILRDLITLRGARLGPA